MIARRLSAALGCAIAGCSSSAAPPPRTASTAAVLTPPPAMAMTPAPPPTRDDPPSRREDVVDGIAGTAVHDPYRWLEDASSPEVQDWMKAQDSYARAHLAKLPNRDAIAARLTELFYFDERDPPEHRGNRYFYTEKHKDQEKSVVYWKEGERGEAKVLLDPNKWSSDGSAGLRGMWPSWDGRYVAYNRNEHNADETTMSVIEVATGKQSDTIDGTKYGGASWAPDSRGFYYVRLPPPSPQVAVADRPGLAELRYHTIGSDPARDPLVHEATKDPQTFLSGGISRNGHWLFAQIEHGTRSNDVYFKDLRTQQKDWTPLIEGVRAHVSIDNFRDVFYVRSDEGAPLYRVFAVDPKKPARASWKELIAESDATLESVQVIGGYLALRYLRNAASEVELHDLQGKLVRKLDLPPLGAVSRIRGEPNDDDAYLSYTSFTEQQVIYKLSVKTGAVTEWSKISLPVDTSQFVTEQVKYPSKDGTQITMFLVHKKDAVKDGKTPTFLTGYGGFNLPVVPGFVSGRSSWGAHAMWMEHGGLIAVPNLRGGNEYGEEWHRAGMLLAKQNVFDDFLAAARWLESSGWTSPDHLAIFGGSNGGLLVGAALTQAPELFKAVVCEVPLLDMVRYHLFGSGKTWIHEYGSAEDPEQFKALFAYSPYHHVRQGAAYPALLLSSSDHDDRVDPMHARKFAALLQWASARDTPVWLRIQANAGHTGAALIKQKIDQSADTYAFLMWQLGVPWASNAAARAPAAESPAPERAN